MRSFWTRSLIVCLYISAAPTLLIAPAAAVGPPASSGQTAIGSTARLAPLPLAVIVPVFNPNIPADPDKYESQGVWPELRNAEAKLFAISVRNALAKTGRFETVRVTPSDYAIGEVYVEGRIGESTSEEIEILITVTDISGKHWLQNKKFKYRVREYDLTNPRSANNDPYQPVFDNIATAIVNKLKRLRSKDQRRLRDTASMVLARSYSAEDFGQYLRERDGQTRLTGIPDAQDPHLRRILEARAYEDKFVDDLQNHYDAYGSQVVTSYREWQRFSFPEAKAYREERAKARRKTGFAAGLAVLAIAGTVATANNGIMSGTSTSEAAVEALATGAALSAAGLGYGAFRNRRESNEHLTRLMESGRRMDLELVPTNVDFAGREQVLTGTADKQFSELREFLQKVYAEDRTPQDVEL